MNQDELQRNRREKDEWFRTSPESPLSAAQQVNFTGLRYFDYNPDVDLSLKLHLFPVREEIAIFTTKNEIRPYRRYGEIRFSIDDQAVRLTIFRTSYGFFLPFIDAAAGTLTYPLGRYLTPEKQPDGLFHVDFNQAYNPYCAYHNRWDCPLTPRENHLSVTIEAGEMLPPGDWLSLA